MCNRSKPAVRVSDNEHPKRFIAQDTHTIATDKFQLATGDRQPENHDPEPTTGD